MITKIHEETYVNIIQLTLMLVAAEFLVAMETIRIYDHEDRKWNLRRVFWYIVLGTPALAWMAIVATACYRII